MEWIKEEIKRLEEEGLLRKPVCVESSHGGRIIINGSEFINFSSNDYLGLSRHPEIVHSAVEALNRYGLGSGASRLLSGTYEAHRRLEERIAEFKGTETSLVFNTGYAANTGIIPAIAGDDTLIFSDELNHASIIDGIRLSRAGKRIYRHRDMDHLETLLRESMNAHIKKRLIVTDTVFSMDGDIAPLKDLVFLSEKYNALLMIDDAHATGVLGETGRGGLEHFGITSDRIIQMGTMSKALGCYGAFIACSKDLINLLINKARSFIYSTSLPPVVVEACIKAFDIIEFQSHGLRKRLWDNRNRLYQGVRDLGYDTLGSETPIIPILAGDVKAALNIAQYLYKNKIFAPAIRPPTVPQGRCRIRFSVSALHSEEEVDTVLRCLRDGIVNTSGVEDC